MIWLAMGVLVIGGMWLLTRIPQECLWCGEKSRLHGALMCDSCRWWAELSRAR